MHSRGVEGGLDGTRMLPFRPSLLAATVHASSRCNTVAVLALALVPHLVPLVLVLPQAAGEVVCARVRAGGGSGRFLARSVHIYFIYLFFQIKFAELRNRNPTPLGGASGPSTAAH